LLPWIGSNEEQRPRIEVYLESLREAGYSEEDHDVFVMYPIYVGEDDSQARAEVEDAWHRWREFALDEVRLDPARVPMLDKIYARSSRTRSSPPGSASAATWRRRSRSGRRPSTSLR